MSDLQSSLEQGISDLRSEGYNATIANGLLIVRDIPYVTNSRSIAQGVIAFPIEIDSGELHASGDHTAFFYGLPPCNHSGIPLSIVANENADFNIPGVGQAKLHLSRKKVFPSSTSSGYANAKEKLETYVSAISTHAERVDPSSTPKAGGIPPELLESSQPFLFPDTASTRVGIGHLNSVFYPQTIAIIGLGGTGSYILDLVAKTGVKEIHLFDNDRFRSHNAFRSPGAANNHDVGSGEYKVDYFRRMYSHFRSGIIAHQVEITEETKEQLKLISFAFVAVDNKQAHNEICSILTKATIPFVDVGMCANIVDTPQSCLVATIRTTFYRSGQAQLDDNNSHENEDDYSSNIQIAELNALNACFAVIRWKKHLGYYQDLEEETISIYDTNVQSLLCR